MLKVSAFFLSLFFCCFLISINSASAYRLAPQSFNEMYSAASSGRIGILKEAVHRGLNIDTKNSNGDTGVCVAIRNWDYRAYNSFRAAGAQSKPYCINEIPRDQVESFMSSSNIPEFFKDDYNAFYIEQKGAPWGWIIGGTAFIAALLAVIL